MSFRYSRDESGARKMPSAEDLLLRLVNYSVARLFLRLKLMVYDQLLNALHDGERQSLRKVVIKGCSLVFLWHWDDGGLFKTNVNCRLLLVQVLGS